MLALAHRQWRAPRVGRVETAADMDVDAAAAAEEEEQANSQQSDLKWLDGDGGPAVCEREDQLSEQRREWVDRVREKPVGHREQIVASILASESDSFARVGPTRWRILSAEFTQGELKRTAENQWTLRFDGADASRPLSHPLPHYILLRTLSHSLTHRPPPPGPRQDQVYEGDAVGDNLFEFFRKFYFRPTSIPSMLDELRRVASAEAASATQ